METHGGNRSGGLFGDDPQRGNPERQAEAEEVLSVWVSLICPHLGVDRGPTPKRLEVISSRLAKGYKKTQLETFFRWVFKSPAKWARFMRDPRKPYLEVENLLRWNHLRIHLHEALRWDLEQDEEVAPVYGGRPFRV